MIKYLLDEHIPPAYRTELLRRDPSLTVWMIRDAGAPAKGTSDPDILLWCEEHSFILVTNNRSTMPGHLADHLAAGGQVPGILTLDLATPMAVALEDLLLIATASNEDEWVDQLVYLPLS